MSRFFYLPEFLPALVLLLAFTVPLSGIAQAASQQGVHHELSINIDPAGQTIYADDTITLPGHITNSRILFFLNNGLSVTSPTEGVQVRQLQRRPDEKSFSPPLDAPVNRYMLLLPEKRTGNILLRYSGNLSAPEKAEGTRGPSEEGSVSEEGLFWSGSDFWYPRFGNELVTFGMKAVAPSPWDIVSQGERGPRSREEGRVTVRWESRLPTDQIILIGGKFDEYTREESGITAMVFLRAPDEELANRYLKTTFFYLDIFQKLLGPYPYKKFALVENFLPTGYGLPSLTLLGSDIIRYPFILHSSYPHELLHNWWGNGVFVDYDSGNWAEGLTVYLADHLIKERLGEAVEYRRVSLQKYSDYVNSANDFPLTSFSFRKSSASQAVGYGKTMMMFNMLRVKTGDKKFVEALRHFYRKKIFTRASFDDIRISFEAVTGQDLKQFFFQWLTRRGAPSIELSGAVANKSGEEYLLSFTLKQRASTIYDLDIPVAVRLEGKKDVESRTVRLNSESVTYTMPFTRRPVGVDVDPGFDIFRRLDRREMPPSLSLAFGSKKMWILLPEKAPQKMKDAYMGLARRWKKEGDGIVEIGFDREYFTLPEGTVWLLGRENSHAGSARRVLSGYDAEVFEGGVRFASHTERYENNSFVMALPRPDDSDGALVWLFSHSAKAIGGLARKLPHYGKYSYLVFSGSEPLNSKKGVWPISGSPLSSPVSPRDGKKNVPSGRRLPSRPALTSLAE